MIRLTNMQRGAIGEARRSPEDARASAVEAPRRARDVIRRADWLRERFPRCERLVKVVDRAEIEAHERSLNPGRHIYIALEGEDGDLEEEMRTVHIDLKGLNEETAGLATHIVRNLENSRV
ncbi:MAG: hypothetical protein OXQ89_14460 [Rhodospirillaceae bacterium]|nr:hypothetical protein [Rhodospirillaceae bacterium]